MPPLFLQHGFRQLIYCAVSVGIWCTLLVLDLFSSTSSCALSVFVIVSRTVDWWTNRGTTTFQRPEFNGPSGSVCLRSRSVLGAQEQQRCSSRVVSLLGVCCISNLVRISREPRCTRPLWTRSSDFLVHVLSRGGRRNFCRSIRRSRSGEFLPLGISIRNSQRASCRPGSLPRCACRTPFHRFRSICFSHRGSRRIGGTAEARHRKTFRHARVDRSQRCVLRGCFYGVSCRTVDSVTSVLAPPANVGVVHAVGRMPFGPDLLSQVIEDGRLGNLDALEDLSRDPEGAHTATSEVPARSFPMPKARAIESPTVARRGQEDPHSLLTTLMKRIETMESSSGPRQASSHQPLGTSTAPNLLGVASKFPPSADYDRAHEDQNSR